MVRAATTSLIYATTLGFPAGAITDETPSVTLMSIDVDRVVGGVEALNETWARLLEIAIGIWLLAREVGPISIAPIMIPVREFSLPPS